MEIENEQFIKNVKFIDYQDFKIQVKNQFSDLTEKELKKKQLTLWKFYKQRKQIQKEEEIKNILNQPKKSSFSSGQKISINKSAFIQVLQKGNINDDFLLYKKQELGQGQHGITYKVPIKKDPTKYRAIKVLIKSVIKNNKIYFRQFTQEVQNLMQLDHANIVRLYAVYEDSLNYYLVMELCEGGEVFERIAQESHFSEENAKQIFKQAIQGINYCHKNNVRHGDIKAENMMFLNKQSNTIKIIDFGFSLKSQDKCNISGSSYYMSPELKCGQTDLLADIYAIGITLYIMITGRPPEKEIKDENGNIQTIHYINFNYKNKKYSEEVQDLIKQCLKPTEFRITAEQILDHPWLKNCNNDQESNISNSQQISENSSPQKSSAILNLQQFQEFTKSLHLRKLLLTHLATNLEEKEILDLQNLFKQIDTNHDGMISFEELKQGLKQNQIEYDQQRLKTLQNIFNEIDTDGSGSIDYTEFLAATIQKNIQIEDNKLRVIFDLIDTNKDGVLQRQEIIDYIKYHSENIQDENQNTETDDTQIKNMYQVDYDKIMNKIDLNGDGEIDFEEFKQLVHGDPQNGQYNNSQFNVLSQPDYSNNENTDIQDKSIQGSQQNEIQNQDSQKIKQNNELQQQWYEQLRQYYSQDSSILEFLNKSQIQHQNQSQENL